MPSPHQPSLFDLEPPQWELDAQSDEQIVSVVFPEKPLGEFDYRVPEELRPQVDLGARLRVPLGKGGRQSIAYCVGLKNASDRGGQLKQITAVLDQPSLISPDVLELARWIADYYSCDLGLVLETVVPQGVRARAGTRLILHYSLDSAARVRIPELNLRGKQEEIVKLLERQTNPVSLPFILEQVACTPAPLQALRKKGIVRSEEFRVVTHTPVERPSEPAFVPNLTSDQQQALDRIMAALQSQQHLTQLIWGVTGSGKTEVYLRAIEEVVRYGRQAIVLVPEISLTPQTRRRFAARLRDVAVLHSHLTPSERHAEWQRIARGEVQVVVGARSAIFAPVRHLGLIILDEEHEGSFKQEIAPRYHAREVAVRRATQSGIPLLLGTATPSLESWHRARTGRYELLTLPKRVENRPLPHVSVIDLRQQYRDKSFCGALSRPLSNSIKKALKEGEQVILLLNRRGFATHIQCPACGFVARCQSCDISLTHHREGDKAICHYCNFQMAAPVRCPECQFGGIRFAGLGTQRLEAELRSTFPEATCLRMDTDTMQGSNSHEIALESFRRGEVQILVGTQMIAKGLDFPNVTLVGVVNADTGLHLPDFRAVERTFQLVTQVAGRTGRGPKGGHVVVQTMNPDHYVIQCAARHDYETFAKTELPLREAHGYPPFGSALRLVYRGDHEKNLQAFAERQVSELRQYLELTPDWPAAKSQIRFLGPGPAPITRLRGKFRYHAIVHGVLQTTEAQMVWNSLCTRLAQLQGKGKVPPNIQWIVDVDPVSML